MSEMQEILYKLTEMGQDIKEIKMDVAELKTRVGNLESSVEQIKTRLEVVVEQTAGLMEFRTETNAIFEDIQEDQLSAAHILGEHEISIRGLRRRLA